MIYVVKFIVKLSKIDHINNFTIFSTYWKILFFCCCCCWCCEFMHISSHHIIHVYEHSLTHCKDNVNDLCCHWFEPSSNYSCSHFRCFHRFLWIFIFAFWCVLRFSSFFYFLHWKHLKHWAHLQTMEQQILFRCEWVFFI